MNVPKYIIEMLNRSEYNFAIGDVGYTIDIHKATPYTKVNTLKDEVERLVKWANKQTPQFPEMPTAKLERIEAQTHYRDQIATVTIYDPVIKHLEAFIGYDTKRR